MGAVVTSDDRRVCVVGSGPAGAAAAAFLGKAGIETTLLDAGSERSAFGITLRVAGFTVAKWRRPLGHRPGVTMTGDPRAKVYEDLSPGGLTNHWSCAVPRFSQEDFADAERAGEAFAWPVGYDDLAPYYDRVEPLLHIAGAAAATTQVPAGRVKKSWDLPADWNKVCVEARAFGREVMPLPYVYGSDTSLTLSGTIFNSFVRLVRPAERAGLLTVRHEARVLRLEVSKATGKVDAVVFRDLRTGNDERIRCRAVVVAAGAINTTQILLESVSRDFPDGLGNTEGVLGKYLHDHPLGKVSFDVSSPLPVHPPAYVTRPLLSKSTPLYAAACAQWGGIQLVAKSVLAGKPWRLPWVGFNVFGTMAPVPENYVALDPDRPSKDGASAIKLHMHHPPESVTALEESRDQVLGVLDRAGLRPRLSHWHIEDVGVAHHYGGSCRMHRSPKFGMLDGQSRLHAVQNVVVADSAAFTTGPEKNPVLTAMTLSARASDRLAADLKSGTI
jgi:choline dehydrogenase-like flavoprotein